MEYARWAPVYERIRVDFGFAWAREEAAAADLRRRLPPDALRRPLERATERLRGRTVVVVGNAPGAGAPPVWRLRLPPADLAIVAADGATAPCLRAGLVPEVVVTDLDGPVASEVTANHRGALVVIHAHGDNRAAIADWAEAFPGAVAGSWAGAPSEGLLNVGGFTDGDRAAYLAEHGGASSILLWGFDFERVSEVDPVRADRKRAKLGWAARALGWLAASTAVPISLWERDGRRRPYPPDAGIAAASTR
ncbi:MAG: 6-hydroxymethylpterin diphosphokinase MptE-like protein [Thermoplasmata archaeon]